MNHSGRRGLSQVLAFLGRALAGAACSIVICGSGVRAQTPRHNATTSPWQASDGQVYLFPALQATAPSTAPQSTMPQALAATYRFSQLSPPHSTASQSSRTPSPAFVLATRLKQALQDPNNDLLSNSDGLLNNQHALGGTQVADESPLSALESMGPARSELPGAGHGVDQPLRIGLDDGEDPHAKLYIDNCYPSAMQCAPCHQRIYDEWRVSAHAYAAVSPMFHKFEQAISQVSQGTIGTFCMRCHAPVATQAGFPREASILDAPYVYREGVTCIACHRVQEAYGLVNGERRIEPGQLHDPVFGSIGGDGIQRVLADKDNFKVKLDSNNKSPGQTLHRQGIKFEQLSDSGFCASCHQVDVHPGIGLEIVWAQYRAGPACKKGISCQDCHMGQVPGKPLGYSYGPAAEISGKTVDNNRKHSNHMFFGPGNSIAHPGIFPHNEKALRWTMEQWMEFDWRSDWGTDAFEKSIAKRMRTVNFPKAWDSADERRDARKVLDENFKLLDIKKASSIAVMEAGSKIDGPFFDSPVRRSRDLRFHYVVSNISEGHNMPSGSLGAQPQLWLNVVLTGPNGQWLWETGYLDANGDLANQHSQQVTQRILPPDRQLFNLQTQFLITGVKGTEREMYLPINVDIDQLPFLRPGAQPVSVLNHPPFIRLENHSIPPLDSRKARYTVPHHLLNQPGSYRLSVRMRSRLEPIYFMRFCNATPEMERRMLEQTIDIHPYAVEFTVE